MTVMNYLSILANLIAIFHGVFFVFSLTTGVLLSVFGILKRYKIAEAILVIVLSTTIFSFVFFGSCFLTTWEQSLRIQAGELSYSGGYISHYLAGIGIQVPDIGVFWFLVIFVTAGTISEIYWNRQKLKKFFSKFRTQ